MINCVKNSSSLRAIANRVMIRPRLEAIFDYSTKALDKKFGL
ncbi:MAG: hypothetical protein ACLFN2_05465 [Bacteroidales bacterium]